VTCLLQEMPILLS